MATMRTPEERMAIAQRCVQLEQEGGDILAYLWSENYLTPRATWCNIQREFLGRKPYEFTDGKPKKEQERNYMQRASNLTDEQRKKACEIAIEGGDPRDYLQECGIRDPQSRWWAIKEWAKKTQPALYQKIPARIGSKGPKVDKEKPKQLQLEAGVDYQVKVAEAPEEKRILDGVDFTKITKPVNFGGYEVTAIRDPQLGEFYFDQKFNMIDWRTPDGEEISLSPDGWRSLARKIPEILGVLGVKV